jgi:GNAT superfamily N-acetyltransferase
MRDTFMKIALNNREYTFLIGYQKEVKYRASFNNLVEEIFGISFEEWYRAGYWNEKYVPYTLFDGDRAIANVSVNIMDFNTFGEPQRYIQIGTVLTDEEYRNQNLSRFLMEYVLTEWSNKCEFIYLFANSTVLELYPKFGFNRVREYEYFKSVEKNSKSGEQFEKLNMDIQSNRDILYDYAKNTQEFGKLSMNENADLVMFYCTSFLKENVYSIKSLDIIAVTTFNDNQLHLWDVFGRGEIKLDKIVNSLINFETDELVLGFTPADCSSYRVREISSGDKLFIQQGKTQLFDENKVMFPLLSHA